MQPDTTREVLWMFVERIVNRIFPDETGASRLQQVGLFTLIYLMQRDPPVTATRIAQITQQSESQIHRQLKKLLELKIIDRKKIVNRQGRGRAFELTIRDTKESKRLIRRSRRLPHASTDPKPADLPRDASPQSGCDPNRYLDQWRCHHRGLKSHNTSQSRGR
jgi:DNA-binding transcriptional ArsR family regulator